MDKTREAWMGHLVMIGEKAYKSSAENPGTDDRRAMLEAVAAMITENDLARSYAG